jgi:hypothetical protein
MDRTSGNRLADKRSGPCGDTGPTSHLTGPRTGCHRELTWILDRWANQEHGKSYDQLDVETAAALKARLKKEIRTNTYDSSTGDLVVSPTREQIFQVVEWIETVPPTTAQQGIDHRAAFFICHQLPARYRVRLVP